MSLGHLNKLLVCIKLVLELHKLVAAILWRRMLTVAWNGPEALL